MLAAVAEEQPAVPSPDLAGLEAEATVLLSGTAAESRLPVPLTLAVAVVAEARGLVVMREKTAAQASS